MTRRSGVVRTGSQKRRKHRLQGFAQCQQRLRSRSRCVGDRDVGDRAIGLVVFEAWSATHRKHVVLDDCHGESRELYTLRHGARK